jgi:hypothetical protein
VNLSGAAIAQRIMRVLAGACALSLAACASPPDGLWPAAPCESTMRVVISSDAWHSMIAIPVDGGFEEWGYAEKGWYFEGSQGIWGAIRALLFPSAGVVEVARVARPYALRSTQGEPKVWELELGAESVDRLRAYLESSLAPGPPIRDDGWRTWHDAAWCYHVFHTCHHYVANGLFEAGVPVYANPCWLPSGLWRQLDEVAQKRR